jgi:hypothetical protein
VIPQSPIEYSKDWNKFAVDVLGVNLDKAQRKILEGIQNNRKISVRSGNARGKDYTAAVASVCFLYLNHPAKVVSTAPTGRQVVSIMMSEISKIWRNAKIDLGGELLANKIKFPDDPDCFLEGFKASDKSTESWSGYHSPNLMVIATEASGLEDETFNAIEGILTGGNTKLVLIFNPNRTNGEAYQSTRSREYVKFRLNCLEAPNVIAKKNIIPGQVDWVWVNEKVKKWTTKINKDEANPDLFDFEWENEDGKKWYRPDDLFLVKVMGEFPREAPDQLIPLSWVEKAIERWKERDGKSDELLRLGVDVAGMGRDKTVFCHRKGDTVEKFDGFSHSDHMETVGRIKNELSRVGDKAFVDTIGEGAGVYSRLAEQNVPAISVKFSRSAKGSDYTGERKFANERAYCWWAIRDALDPKFGAKLALPDHDDMIQDLTEPKWKIRSNGDILIEEKEEIKKRLGRSPDFGDALAVTYSQDSDDGWGSFEVRDR